MLRKENQISRANNYIIENFSEHHLDDVMEIEIHANPTPWSKQTFEKILEQRSLSFVVIENSQIVGFCIANKMLDECHLQNISVIDAMRRQGLAPDRYQFNAAIAVSPKNGRDTGASRRHVSAE